MRVNALIEQLTAKVAWMRAQQLAIDADCKVKRDGPFMSIVPPRALKAKLRDAYAESASAMDCPELSNDIVNGKIAIQLKMALEGNKITVTSPTDITHVFDFNVDPDDFIERFQNWLDGMS